MLSNSEVHADVPAGDLKRARAFYVDKLGLVGWPGSKTARATSCAWTSGPASAAAEKGEGFGVRTGDTGKGHRSLRPEGGDGSLAE
jgi:catechol 2,3-dioxygenase-like lactoylglutathione lyase family enzyme